MMKKVNMLFFDFVVNITAVIMFLLFAVLSTIHVNKIASLSVLSFVAIIIVAVIEAVSYQKCANEDARKEK